MRNDYLPETFTRKIVVALLLGMSMGYVVLALVRILLK